MPTLKNLTCHVENGRTNLPLEEWCTFYHGNLVECYIAVPENNEQFSVHLISDDFISPGLAMFVFIDGVHQCNRNRRDLVQPGENAKSSGSTVDFRVRQQEERMDDELFLGRQWTFKELKKSSPSGNSSRRSEEMLNSIGQIEVVILRCKEVEAASMKSIYSSFGTPKTALGLALRETGCGAEQDHEEFTAVDGARDSISVADSSSVRSRGKNDTENTTAAFTQGLLGLSSGVTNQGSSLTKWLQGLSLDGESDGTRKSHSRLVTIPEDAVPQIDGSGDRRMKTAMVVNQYLGKSSGEVSSRSSGKIRSQQSKSRSHPSNSSHKEMANDNWDNDECQNTAAWDGVNNDNNAEGYGDQEHNDAADAWKTTDVQGNTGEPGWNSASTGNNVGNDAPQEGWQNNNGDPNNPSWNLQSQNDASDPKIATPVQQIAPEPAARSSKVHSPVGLKSTPTGPSGFKSYWSSWNKGKKKKSKIREGTESVHVASEVDADSVPEDFAARESLSHQMKLGKGITYAKKVGKPAYIDSFKNPYAVFVFKYRSKDVVQDIVNKMYQTRIPRKYRDDPESKAKSRFMNMSKEELFLQLRVAKKQLGYSTESELETSSSDEDVSKVDDAFQPENQDAAAAGTAAVSNWNDGSARGSSGQVPAPSGGVASQAGKSKGNTSGSNKGSAPGAQASANWKISPGWDQQATDGPSNPSARSHQSNINQSNHGGGWSHRPGNSMGSRQSCSQDDRGGASQAGQSKWSSKGGQTQGAWNDTGGGDGGNAGDAGNGGVAW